MRKNEEDQSARMIRYMLGVLLGGIIALAACFILLLLASAGISSGKLSQDSMYQITMISCVVSTFLGGMVAVKRCRARVLIVGLATSTVFFLLLLTIGVIFFGVVAPEAGGIGLLCGSLLGGAAAGLLASRVKGTVKRRRRK